MAGAALYQWPDQLRAFIVSSAPVLVAAVGMTLVIICRQIDISIGSIFSVCGVIAGLLAQAGFPIGVVVLGTLLAGGLLGSINGVLVAGLGLPSIVVTLATLVIWRGSSCRHMAREGEFVRNLATGVSVVRLGLRNAGQWIVVAIAAGRGIRCVRAWGLRNLAALTGFVYATGSDPEAARLAGIRPRRVVFGVFVTMGTLAALAALLSAVRFADVDPNSGAGLELQVIAAVVVGGVAVTGGRGTLAGSAIGVALLGAITPALVFLGTNPHLAFFGSKPQWEKAIQGLIILLAVTWDSLYREGR